MASLYKRISSTALAVLDTVDYYNVGLIITRINVPSEHRGQGHASGLLSDICSYADKNQINLFLEIAASDGLNRDQLENWYRRYGFKDIGGIYRRRYVKNAEAQSGVKINV